MKQAPVFFLLFYLYFYVSFNVHLEIARTTFSLKPFFLFFFKLGLRLIGRLIQQTNISDSNLLT